MPPVIIPIITLGGLLTVGQAIIGLIGIGLSVASAAYQRKQQKKLAKRLSQSALGGAAERTVLARSSIEPRRYVMGEPPPMSGLLVYAESTGANKEYMWLVIALAAHQVQYIGDIWIDDERVPASAFDGSGDVTTGRFAGYLRVKKYLGTSGQTADADLVAASAGIWTTNHRMRGCAAIYVRLLRNDTVYPNGLPNIRAQVKGALCYDPRDLATRYTENPALLVRHYLTSTAGLSAGSTEIDDTQLAAAANLCEERVAVSSYTSPAVTLDGSTDTLTFAASDNRIGTGDGVQVQTTGSLSGTNLSLATTYYAIRTGPLTLKLADNYAAAIAGTARDITGAGTGTHTLAHIDQARYTCNGTWTADSPPRQAMEDMLSTMGGACVYAQGDYRVFGGAYVSPTVTLTESDLRGPVSYVPKPPRSDLFNAVKAIYVDPFLAGQPTDAPLVQSSSFKTADGSQDLVRDLELGHVTNVIRAQRLAKIALLRGRPGRLSLPCKLTAVRIATMDTVQVTLDLLGFSAKVFRVVGWTLHADEQGAGVDLELEEEASSDWTWSAGDATVPAVQTPVALPPPRDVAVPTSLTAASGNAQLLRAADGTIISRIKISWTAAAEPNLAGYELRYKRSTESDYTLVQLPTDSTVYYLSAVRDGDDYNLGVRTRGAGGARSTWATLTHTVVGKTDAPTAPTTLGVAPAAGGFDISWDACPDADYWATELYEASSNDRTTATKIAEVVGIRMSRSGLAGGLTRYYWIRNLDTTGNVSTWYPVSSTAGVSGTSGSTGDGKQITHDTTSYLAGGATGYLTGTGYWLGYNSGNYRMHLGNPSGAHMKWDGSALTVKGSIFTGDITVDSGGNVRGGQTAYDTGTGFFLGYSGGAYKFSIGNSSGSKLTWDGTTLSITGSIQNTRAYEAGTNVIASADNVQGTGYASYTKVKEIQLIRGGTLTVDFDLANNIGGTAYGRIYKNGSAVGTERSAGSTSYTTYSENIGSLSAGDLLQLYVRYTGSTSGFARNFRLKCGWTLDTNPAVLLN